MSFPLLHYYGINAWLMISKLIENLWGTTMHIHTHTFITSLSYELGRCHLYDVVIITTNARWLIGDCLSCYTCFWWVAGIQTHTIIICKTIEKHVRSSKILLLIIPTSFDFAATCMPPEKLKKVVIEMKPS